MPTNLLKCASTDLLQHCRPLHLRHTIRLQRPSHGSCLPRPKCRIHRRSMRRGHSSFVQTSTTAEDDCSEAEAVATSTRSSAAPGKDWQSGHCCFVVRPGLDGSCEGALDGSCGGAGGVWMWFYPGLCKSAEHCLRALARAAKLTFPVTAQHLNIPQRSLRRAIRRISLFRQQNGGICMRRGLSSVHQTK